MGKFSQRFINFSREFMRAFLDLHVRCFMEFTLKLKVQILQKNFRKSSRSWIICLVCNAVVGNMLQTSCISVVVEEKKSHSEVIEYKRRFWTQNEWESKVKRKITFFILCQVCKIFNECLTRLLLLLFFKYKASAN